ncbi:hypothetical protein V8B55DRAFT_1347043 [Mucor lusitanicus]|uniref:MARVEL domain-containing protein n=2 Tax=Mucor circinelloides f. lusitanicus TaxID=29924 RepID=A0A168K5A8_MUCCL|nr:hypothetical protein FB192DRAFT_1350193 [Mucor lusitanicus]OAD02021.1 hypothetical protein MUCCIDRAFT_82401 [Mucor lusitanicus CBS 277.49]
MDDTKNLSQQQAPPPPVYQPSPQFDLPASSSSLSIAPSSIHEKNMLADEEQLQKVEDHKSSSGKWRLILRIVQLFCVVGSFGFQASANAWSGRTSVPFDNVALLYFFYGIEWAAFIWSSFCIYVQASMQFNSKHGNIKPAVGLAMDTLLAVLLGIAISMEIGAYTCPAGGFDGWCNFYNTGVSFGMLLFITFGANALWDLFSGLSCLRTK